MRNFLRFLYIVNKYIVFLTLDESVRKNIGYIILPRFGWCNIDYIIILKMNNVILVYCM